MIIDRQLLGDLALAMLLVLPTAAFAGSQLPAHRSAGTTSATAKAIPAERSMAERGVGLLS